jgi:DNA topoisomerase-1
MPAPDSTATLTFTDLDGPGIARRRRGRSWQFVDPDGRTITCPRTRARLLKLALPPAYADAWYNPDPDGHIQAVGIDARGRRQYRYHPEFRAAQEQAKYEGLARFGAALPAIRDAVAAALADRALGRERVIAAVVRLLDIGFLRVGNEAYARENRSFGATTLRRRHAQVEGARLRLRFRAKSGVERRVTLSDRALAGTVRRCQELPGQHLFCYEASDGSVRPIGSDDVNSWLRDVTGQPVSAR